MFIIYARLSNSQMLKETKYTVSLPQLRQCPPLPSVPVVCALNESAAPEPQQSPPPEESKNFKLNANAQSWVPYEQGAPSYWSQTANTGERAAPATPSGASCEKSLIELLRDDSATGEVSPAAEESENKLFQRHGLNCPNEQAGFALLRQMYPNKQLSGLWDLFVKCQADVDWAVDILLKEDELNSQTESDPFGMEAALSPEELVQFQCECGGPSVPASQITDAQLSPSTTKLVPKPQRQSRSKRNASSNNKELQIQIQNCFVLGND